MFKVKNNLAASNTRINEIMEAVLSYCSDETFSLVREAHELLKAQQDAKNKGEKVQWKKIVFPDAEERNPLLRAVKSAAGAVRQAIYIRGINLNEWLSKLNTLEDTFKTQTAERAAAQSEYTLGTTKQKEALALVKDLHAKAKELQHDYDVLVRGVKRMQLDVSIGQISLEAFEAHLKASASARDTIVAQQNKTTTLLEETKAIATAKLPDLEALNNTLKKTEKQLHHANSEVNKFSSLDIVEAEFRKFQRELAIYEGSLLLHAPEKVEQSVEVIELSTALTKKQKAEKAKLDELAAKYNF
jgi:uncharacterized membrane protein YdfJ with MMPL/SSD domain